jgi:hypothetical protein
MLRKRVDTLLGDCLTPELKRRGFRKKGALYSRAIERVTHLVDVQYSRWNDKERVSFTLNCGIHVRGVTSTFRGTREPPEPKPSDCCMSVRAGMLTKTKQDVWWEVLEPQDPEAEAEIGRQVPALLTDAVLPFLSRFETEEAVALFLSEERAPEDDHVEPRAPGLGFAYAGILWRALGNSERASACLADAVKRASNTPLEETVSNFARRFAG